MGTPAHSVRPARLRRAGIVAGLGAIVVAAAVAVPTLRSESAPAADTVTTARSLTVQIPQAAVPLSESELQALVGAPADLGGLGDPARLASCLDGLGYPGETGLLGGRAVEINSRPAVVLLLAGEDPAVVTALAVSPQCTAAHTGLVADTTVARP